MASVLPKLSVLYGVWADISSVDTWWYAAVQRWRRQRRLPGYQPGGQIRRVQIRLRLWRSYNKVRKRCTLILFSVSFAVSSLSYAITGWPVLNVMICASGVKSRSLWTHGMSWECPALQRAVSFRWTARGQWKELLRYFGYYTILYSLSTKYMWKKGFRLSQCDMYDLYVKWDVPKTARCLIASVHILQYASQHAFLALLPHNPLLSGIIITLTEPQGEHRQMTAH